MPVTLRPWSITVQCLTFCKCNGCGQRLKILSEMDGNESTHPCECGHPIECKGTVRDVFIDRKGTIFINSWIRLPDASQDTSVHFPSHGMPDATR